MPAKTTGKTAVKKTAVQAKKDSSSRPAPASSAAPAQRAPDAGVQQLEQKLREAEGCSRRLERELHDAQAALQSAAKERSAGAAADLLVGGVKKLRCPRCSGAMTEYQHDVVRADRCDSCHGIFFDDGELEQVMDKALKDHDGQKQGSWFQTIFGRRGKTEQA